MVALQPLVWICLLQASPTPRVTMTASALVVQGRQAEARRKAIGKALRRAVMAQAQTFPGLRRARNRLLAEFKTYVRSYRVIEERFVGNGRTGHYRVTLEITLDKPALSRLSHHLSGTMDAPSPCIHLTANPPALEKTAGAVALVHLAAAGFKTTCRQDKSAIAIHLACSTIAQGKVGHQYGATARCSLTSPRASASTRGSALGRSPQEARTGAARSATARAADLLARKLEEALACRRLRRIIIEGPAGPAARLLLAQNILQILPQKTKTAIKAGPNRLVLTLVTKRCNIDLLQAVGPAGIPQRLRVTPVRRGADISLHVTIDKSGALESEPGAATPRVPTP